MKNKNKEVHAYDHNDTSTFIDKNNPLTLNDLGLKLPKEKPTKIISIRLPTHLYNLIKAFSTQRDMPYQAYIKYLLSRGLKNDIKKNN